MRPTKERTVVRDVGRDSRLIASIFFGRGFIPSVDKMKPKYSVDYTAHAHLSGFMVKPLLPAREELGVQYPSDEQNYC